MDYPRCECGDAWERHRQRGGEANTGRCRDCDCKVYRPAPVAAEASQDWRSDAEIEADQ